MAEQRFAVAEIRKSCTNTLNCVVYVRRYLLQVPSAVVRVLKYVRRWGTQIPIYITECGWSNKPDASFDDTSRIKFYRNYIGAALYCKHLYTTQITLFHSLQ